MSILVVSLYAPQNTKNALFVTSRHTMWNAPTATARVARIIQLAKREYLDLVLSLAVAVPEHNCWLHSSPQ